MLILDVASHFLLLLDTTQISVVLKLILKQSDWSMETQITWDAWSCSTMAPGAQSVMISGRILMQKWLAGQLNALSDRPLFTKNVIFDDSMLGFGDAVCAVTSNQFGQATSSVPFWMDNVQCLGSEDALDRCSFPGWGNNNCNHATDDAGVVCKSEDGSYSSNSGWVAMTLS